MKKVMIIYANYGTGHFIAAKAIEKELKNQYPNIIVECFNPLTYARPIINKLFAFCGKMFASRFRKQRENIYKKYMYNKYANLNKFVIFCSKLFWSKKLEAKINNFNPDLVISTQVAPTGLIAMHNIWKHINVKIAAVLTDYAIHKMYVMPHEYVDLYFVPTNSIKEDMEKLGVKKEKIHVSGIPISSSFKPALYNDDTILKELSFFSSKLKILFVCGGGEGYNNAFSYFESIINSDAEFEYIFISGNNKKLYKKACSIASKSNRIGKVMGYVNNIPELMKISNIIIGKPGGLITSESLAMNKPFCAIEPIPGQETKNAEFLVNNNYGYYIKNINDFNDLIAGLSKDKSALKTYENNINSNYIKNSVSNIVKVCLDYIKK